ncbi:hypothetical protein JMJ55_24600 [Belnapia sp. T6]|uniref:Ca2+-binding protein, RTX toxin-related n=1 Tax=Belnapia mucosa TaxID=2804532 RepID=A0ABS1VA25_9PROT|nr:calcium-binding protein [Belnapia mucosa]MBL6458522.1 hypothetical protein [Belnapia mucosa]
MLRSKSNKRALSARAPQAPMRSLAPPPAIEMIEPRLLLSGTTVNAAALHALHDNLAHFETALDGSGAEGVLAKTIALINVNDSRTAGGIVDLDGVFDKLVVSVFDAMAKLPSANAPVDSGDLASKLASAILDNTGKDVGDVATVQDLSSGSDIVLKLSITDVQKGSFSVDFGTLGDTYGISAPDVIGTTASTYNFAFKITLHTASLPATPTDAQAASAFAIADTSYGVTLNAKATLAGQDIHFGLLTLTADAVSTKIDLNAKFTGTALDMTGTELATLATEVKAGDHSDLIGAGAKLTTVMVSQSSGTLLDLALLLDEDHAIPGIDTFTAKHLKVTGGFADGTAAYDTAPLFAALKTAVHNPDFDPKSLNTFSPTGLLTYLQRVGEYIDKLSIAKGLDIEIPFTSGVTIGEVIDTADAFKAAIIDPMANTVGVLGFDEGQFNSGGNYVESHRALTASDIAHLPETIGITLSLDNGRTTTLQFAPHYKDINGDIQQVDSVDHLVLAINQAIATSAIKGYVQASNDAGRINLLLTAPENGTAAKKITVTSATSISLFASLREFGISLAKILHLDGWDDTSGDPEVGTKLLEELGLGYNSETNAVELTLQKEFELPSIHAPFEIDFSLGDVAGLKLTNATFSLKPSVLLSLTLGFDLDPLGSDLNQDGGPQVGDGKNGTPDTALGDLPVYVQAAGADGTIPITARQIAEAANPAGDYSKLADLQIIGREGLVKQYVLTPGMTLGNLETIIATDFGSNIELHFNDDGNAELSLVDDYTPYKGASPASMGLAQGTTASAAKVGSTANYHAVLTGEAPSGADYSHSSKFILSVGKLAPVVVSIGATGSASAYVSAINAALAGIDVDATDLGLPAAKQLHYSDIVKATLNANGSVTLTTTIYDAIKTATGGEPTLSSQRSAVQSTLRVDTVTLTVSALHGSLLPGLLGLVGSDINGSGKAQSIIIGSPLHGETLADRFYLRDSGISAIITAELEPTDPDEDVTISGSLGPFGLSATLYSADDPAPIDAYISLKASLLLNSDLNPVPNLLTFKQLTDALSAGDFKSIWAFRLDSGRDGEPFAKLAFHDIDLTAGSVQLTGAVAPSVTISLDGADELLDGTAPKPEVEVEGFSPTLTAANAVEAIRQTFSALDEGLATTQIPLINVSLDDILGFTSEFLVALGQAQEGEKGTFTEIEDTINRALGADVVHIKVKDGDQLIISLNYKPVDVATELPFDLDLQSLASQLGEQGGLVASLAETIGSIASLSASGTLNVTASASLALTLGINLGENSSPAELATKIAALNSGRGLHGATSAGDDIKVTLGNGKSFTASLSALGQTATVQDLLDTLNTAAAKVGLTKFASYDAKTGKLTFADNTTSDALGVAKLGFTDGQAGIHSGSTVKLTAGSAISAADYAKAYDFSIGIGNGVTAEVVLEADATRTTSAAFLSALRTALAEATVSAKALKAENVPLSGLGAGSADYDVSVGQLLQVSLSGGKLVFSAKAATLGTDALGNLMNNITVKAATPTLAFHVESINGSTVLKDLGFGGDSLTTEKTVSGARSLTGALTAPNSASERFYVLTGEDPVTHDLLTGVTAKLGVSSDDLNFKVGLGPISATVKNGTAHFGADLGHKAAGDTGFKVGDAEDDPATFTISLADGFGGSDPKDGKLSFADLAKLSSPDYSLKDLVEIEADAAVDLTLPVYALGAPIGPVTLQVGNLFNSDAVPTAPGRTVYTDFPDLSGISLGSILNDPQTMIDGLDAFLSTLDSGPMAQALFGLNLPLIGDALQGIGGFFADLHANVIDTLQSLLDSFITSHPGQPATTQNIITQGLNYVLNDILHLPGEIYSYIDSIANPTEISFLWHFDKTLFDATVNIDATLGIPGLGLDITNGDIHVRADLEATIGFGYQKDKGFFVLDTGTPKALTNWTSNNNPDDPFTINLQEVHALEISIAAWLPTDPAFEAALSLGFLRMTAVNGSELKAEINGREIAGTSLTGSLYVDIGPKDTDGRLLFSEMSKTPLRVGVIATVNVDLLLDAGIGIGSTSMALPSVSTELLFSYTFAKVFVGALGNEAESGVEVPITFKDVTLDIGSFLTDILKPILDTAETILGPLQPILDFLTAPIPGLSAFMGPTSILDLAQTFGGSKVQEAVKFIRIVDQVAELVHTLHEMSSDGNVKLNFGTFVLGKTDDPDATSLTSSNVDPFSSKISKTNTKAAEQQIAANAAKYQAAAAASLNKAGSGVGQQIGGLENTKTGGGKPVIEFPILKNPMSVLKLLLGMDDPADLIHITLPTFDFSFSKEIDFLFMIGPVPVTVQVYVEAGVTINLAFGYDTLGIQHFISDGNPLQLLDGFYVDNTLGPQLSFYAAFGVRGGVNLALVAAGIGGELRGQVDFQLVDVSGTGKVRFSVLLEELINNPLQIFKIDGAITAKVYVWAWVGVSIPLVGKITIFETSFDLISVTLLSFSYDYQAAHSTPQLAHVDEDGVLQLNMGENAERQAVGGNLYNPDQEFTVKHVGGSAGDETIEVTANGVTRTYSHVKKITANLGDGNSHLKLEGGLTSDATIIAGDGDNVVELGGVDGDPLMIFGDGNNMIIGATTATTIQAGNGNNTIQGGNTRNTITAGNGNNIITGGTEVDVISVGSGNNVIYGNEGDDSIVVTGGNNTIYGGAGANVISIQNSAGQNLIFGDGPNTGADNDSAKIDADYVALNMYAGDNKGSTITGGNGADTIFGGDGNNLITGIGGQDVIFGSRGSVTRAANGNIILIEAGDPAGGNNTIIGGSAESFLIGGAGSDSILGGAKADIILADLGTIDGEAGGSGGQFHVTALALGGNDTVLGNGGNDVIMGGAGSNALDGGNGNDIIAGHQADLIRTGFGTVATLVSIETTSEGVGGANSIQGGAGSDVILGGAGSQSIDAGTGTDVVIGHFGSVVASNGGGSLTIQGRHSADPGNGDSIIKASHSAVIMGGGGNDTIQTFDNLQPADPVQNTPAVTSADRTEVIFGGNGYVTMDYLPQGGLKIHQARTEATEENTGGNNVITTADGNNFVFGGSGNNTITTGQGSSVIFGHIGAVDLDRLATPKQNGIAPDVLGFTRGQDGSVLATTGSTIMAGNGNNIIMGGAGDNSITAGTGNNIIFGAAGSVTRDGRVGANNALILAQTVEESLGGNNRITVGLGGLGNNLVFGGAGTNVIRAGDGNNILFGHLGIENNGVFSFSQVQRADGSRPDLIGRTVPEIGSTTVPTPDLDKPLAVAGGTIIAGRGNNIIIGGAGNNVIQAAGGDNTVFGASGAVTRTAVGGSVLVATTIEENLGGSHQITLGNGRNLVFGGAGNNLITVGDRDNIVFGHLGQVNLGLFLLYTDAQRASGALPDIVGRVLPELGNRSPRTTAPFTTLDQPMAVAGSTIYAGNGKNVIMGGAGDNTIVAGYGSNLIFGSAGAVTRDSVNRSVVYATTVEEAQGGNNTIAAGLRGTSSQVIFGGPGFNRITAGPGNNIILGHLGAVDFGIMSRYTNAQRADGTKPDIIGRVIPEVSNLFPFSPGGTAGLDQVPTHAGGSVITVGRGDNIIVGGAGNNSITTGSGNNIVFGAAGVVTRDPITGALLDAHTVEETQGGKNVLRLGTGAPGSNIAFGGPGNNTIAAGDGNNVLIGHLGQVNYASFTAYSPADRASGAHPDVLGRTIPVVGNVTPATTAPFAGLGSPLPTDGATIIAGAGNNVVMGGAGVNSIKLGAGNNIVVGASGKVTRTGPAGTLITASETELGYAQAASITTGGGTNIVLNSGGSAPKGAPALTSQPVYVVAGTDTLASAQDLASLAGKVALMAAESIATTTTAAAPATLPAERLLRPGTTTLYDEASGLWRTEEEEEEVAAPLLDAGATTPVLDLGPLAA